MTAPASLSLSQLRLMRQQYTSWSRDGIVSEPTFWEYVRHQLDLMRRDVTTRRLGTSDNDGAAAGHITRRGNR
jgi:hypothetical protein